MSQQVAQCSLLFLLPVSSPGWWWLGGLVAKSCPTLATPWTVAYQAPLSMGFSRQEYWSGLPFPSPGDLPDQESNPGLLHGRQVLYHLSYKGRLPGWAVSLFPVFPSKDLAQTRRGSRLAWGRVTYASVLHSSFPRDECVQVRHSLLTASALSSTPTDQS